MTTKIPAVLLLTLSALGLAGCASPEERAADYAAKAEAALAKGDVDDARIEAQNAIQVQPKNARARYVLAQTAEKAGEIGQMLNHLAIVVGEDKTNVPARVKLGTTLLYAQDYAGAELLSGEATQLAPDDPGVLMLRARVALQKNDLPGALLLLSKVIDAEPKNVDAALLRGLALGQTDVDQGLADLAASVLRVDREQARGLRQARIDLLNRARRPAEVEQELVALVADYPKAGLARDLSNFYAANNEFDKAAAALETAVAADPDNLDLKVALAQFQSRVQKKPEIAERTLKKFIAEAPEDLRLPVMLGTFYEGSNRPADALVQYQVAADKGPKTSEGQQARSRIAALQTRTDARLARQTYDSLLEDVPDNVLALVGRGELSYAEGRYDEAIADLRGGLRSAPENELALLILAQTHRKLGDPKLAEDAYRRLLQVNPNNADGAVELSQLLAVSGQLDEATALLNQVLENQPDNLAARLRAQSGLIDILLAKNDLVPAEAKAREIAALDDPMGLGALQLGQVLSRKQDFNGAEAAFQQALKKSPQSLQALEGLILTLTSEGKLVPAETFLRGYLRENPEQWNAEILLGGNLLRQGRFEEAQKVLKPVLAEQPKSVRGWITLAAAYPKDPKGRIAVLLEAGKAAPKSSDLALLLATAYEQEGKLPEAIATYERVLEANPKDVVAANNLAALLLDPAPNAATAQRALDLAQPFTNSRNPQYLDTLGWANYRKGDMDSAVKFLELAIAFGGDTNPIVRYHLGMAYLASDNPVGAKQELTKAIALGKDQFPGAKEAKAALATL